MNKYDAFLFKAIQGVFYVRFGQPYSRFQQRAGIIWKAYKTSFQSAGVLRQMDIGEMNSIPETFMSIKKGIICALRCYSYKSW